ncbi:hypothetical protein [Thermomonas carbonis]|uniref:Tetratricopeptide repeat protein n=1 Tax=Thermomonas carbonis TaxID=1463158 RepID=A0A7G9SLS4_9GAMM|nr:hypothetical protein [Thermomonas carbonis]QNN68799.1 hypothetical protein H9L16_08580 [Thermomonas carbonis]GHC08670.1 hypothetical protein GCM10010080_24610 [Thermomonas carbonis]
MNRFATLRRKREAWLARWGTLPLGWRGGILAVFAGLLLAFVVAIVFRQRIGDWIWPDPRAEALRTQAGVALAAGRLSVADGSGARELYEAALALQPDQVEAREGLSRVALAALAQAEAHARAGREAQARIALRLARELDAPKARIDAAEALLRMDDAAQAGIGALLAEAESAHAAGHLLEGTNAALPLYQRVLALQPRNQRAVEGREDALSDLLQPVTGLLTRGDLAGAASRIQAAERFDAGHVDLPALHAGLAQAVQQRSARIRQSLLRGRHAAAADACVALREVAASAVPGECSGAVVDGLLRDAAAATADFRFDETIRLLALLEQLDGDAVRVQAARRHLQEARAGAAHLPRPLMSPRVTAQVRDLLAQAEAARTRGDWLSPPGDSAWDRLREARALAPADPAVQRALQAMLPAARDCNATALRDNDLGRAQVCLEAWRQLAPADAAIAAAQRRLGERWLAIGEERLGAGELEATARALARARALDAATPGLQELQLRLERARSGAN